MEILPLRACETKRVTGRAPSSTDRIFLSPRGHPWTPGTAALKRHLDFLLEIAEIDKHAGGLVCIHALRHTFATRLARAGVPIQIAQALTGHRTIGTLLGVYTHLRAEEGRFAIERLPPLGTSGSLRIDGDASTD